MRYVLTVALFVVAGCGSSPTAPSPTPPVAVVPPVVTPPDPLATPPQARALLTDPRFQLALYQKIALGTVDLAGRATTLRRRTSPPAVSIMKVDDSGQPITSATLDATAAAIINTTSLWTGQFGVASLVFVDTAPPAVASTLTVRWNTTTQTNQCAQSDIAGAVITVFLRTPNCTCSGLQIRPAIVKHELGHALGFWHTDDPHDLMYFTGSDCDRNPSEKELFHTRLAYLMPIGSAAP